MFSLLYSQIGTLLYFLQGTAPLFWTLRNPISRRRAFLVAIAESKGRLLSQYISQSAPSAIRASRNLLQREKAVRRYGIPDFVGARLVPPLRRHEGLHVRVRVESLLHVINILCLCSGILHSGCFKFTDQFGSVS